jgi:acyl-CoA dehydrogenase
MANYFLNPGAYPEVTQRSEAANDDFLFNQGPTRGLGAVRFHDYNPVFDRYDLPNVTLFRAQIALFKECMTSAPPDATQSKDLDFLMALGEIFALVVYAQLVLENARIYALDAALVDQIFDVFVRDCSRFALQLYTKPSSTPVQMEHCLRMIRKPVVDADRYQRVWTEHVFPLNGLYAMND